MSLLHRDDLTWSCMVCQDVRPDRLISVFKVNRRTERNVEVQANVRYCNDRAACLDGAPGVGERLLGRL